MILDPATPGSSSRIDIRVGAGALDLRVKAPGLQAVLRLLLQDFWVVLDSFLHFFESIVECFG